MYLKITKSRVKYYRVMVFNATFINISVISWQSILLMGEAGVPGENHGPAACNVLKAFSLLIHVRLVVKRKISVLY
jgi:hypothetical protein